MKTMRLIIIAIAVVTSGSCLMGCANKLVVKINEDSTRIAGQAQFAKEQFEDCLMKNDKDACDNVEKTLNDIIVTSNELSETFKR